jgi:hypothetical protein
LIRKWFSDWVEDKPEPTKPNGDAIPVADIAWLGANYGAAPITAKLNGATMDANWLHLANSAPSTWPTSVDRRTGKTLQAIACLFYERGNAIVGGKYEYCKPNDKDRSLHNLKTGYQGHTMPHSGAKVWAALVSLDGQQRTNIVEVQRA